jgi:hypothetical protein
MSCGCKKQNNEQVQQPVQTQQQQNNETVKQAVTKIVEKYYNKK